MFDIDLTKYRIVDLSYEVVPGASEDRPFDAVRGRLADDCFKYDVSRTHTHVGTHVELPAHYWEDGADVVAFPPEAFMGRGILFKIDATLEGPAITTEYCEQQLGGLIQAGDCVLCRNDNPATVTGNAEDLPHLTPDAASYLRGKQIKILGIDDKVRLSRNIPEGRKLHEILMGAGCNLVEFLDNLAELGRDEFYFMALPWKIQKMDSSWCRAIAIEEKAG